MISAHKIKQYTKMVMAFVQRLRDIRFAGLMLFVVAVLLVSWSGIKAIDTNYRLQKQIAAAEQQTAVQELENTNLKLKNQYLESDQYLELSARQNFGLAAPGEKELIVPSSVALAHTVPEPKPEERPAQNAKQPFYQRNFQAWVDFFLHRQNQPASRDN